MEYLYNSWVILFGYDPFWLDGFNQVDLNGTRYLSFYISGIVVE